MIDAHQMHFSVLDQLILSGPSVKRLLMSCAMGGAIGIEREFRHKDSGLRTNMLICMGAALFTIMSVVLSGDVSSSHGQVAANIVQGVGFLGAGLILHTKNRVMGLTSAATVFTVAAIGMTCGAGLYLVALLSTTLVLLALQLIGAVEKYLGWKRYPVIYEVRAEVGATLSKEGVGAARAEAYAQESAEAIHRMQCSILKALDAANHRLAVLERDNVAGLERVAFTVLATKKTHHRLLLALRRSDATDSVRSFADIESD